LVKYSLNNSNSQETVIKEVVRTVEIEKTVEVTPTPFFNNRVTLLKSIGQEPTTFDPALAADMPSIDHIHNLFVTLTKFDPVTGEVLPNLATHWEVSDDGLEWIFKLRNDVKWVHYNPLTHEITPVTNDNGSIRFVNAYDVEYGIQRSLNPNTSSNYAYLLDVIKNAQMLSMGKDAAGNDTDIPYQERLGELGMKALDQRTITFTLEYPAAYFPSIMGMWLTSPMPQWTIEAWADKWTEAGLINTSGPYALAEWIHNDGLMLLKNPYWFDADNVQIEVYKGLIIEDDAVAFAMYENNELDTVHVPIADLHHVKNDPQLSKELHIAPLPCTYYYGFTHTKEPFNDVRIRRAFSAAVDRLGLIETILGGEGIPANTFAPPGIFGASTSDKHGQDYDPELAKSSFHDFLDEKGLTVEEFNTKYAITLGYNTSEGHAKIATAIQHDWQKELGVKVKIEDQDWQTYLATIEKTSPIESMHHVWRAAWCSDYPDAHNWLHDVFNSQAGINRIRRNCSDPNCGGTIGSDRFDELTESAILVTSAKERLKIYTQTENILAGRMAAYIPIYHYADAIVTKAWLTRNYPFISGFDLYNWKIDVESR